MGPTHKFSQGFCPATKERAAGVNGNGHSINSIEQETNTARVLGSIPTRATQIMYAIIVM